MKSTLEHKTIRPGSLNDYSYYYSNRTGTRVPAQQAAKTVKRPAAKPALIVLAVLAIAVLGFKVIGGQGASTADTAQTTKVPVASQQTDKTPAVAAPATKLASECTGAGQYIRISISKRHLWACNGTTAAYDSKVITGMEQHASTLTPVGTYKIYAKQADTVLTGSDETGSWRDPVSYWMPFLNNKYGTYGFHDAKWRSNDEFGAVDPNTDKASHGCIELPLAASAWLYNWAPVGTSVTIEA